MSNRQRAMFVAQNPGLAAQFFDLMIKSFVDIILRCKNNGPGLFGMSRVKSGLLFRCMKSSR
jgi:hypothetical protein